MNTFLNSHNDLLSPETDSSRQLFDINLDWLCEKVGKSALKESETLAITVLLYQINVLFMNQKVSLFQAIFE